MSSQRRGAPTTGASRWAGPSSSARQLSSSSLYGYVLDLDDDLAEVLEVRMRYSARQQATARLLDADAGECDLTTWFAVVGHGPGLLLINGLVAVDTRVADRTTTELLGSGDLLQPPGPHDDEMVDRETLWRALAPSRFALLDSEFTERVRSWPQVLNAVFQRAERRSDDLDVMRAISCQPRLEVRLVLLLWHLAARWGRVEPGGLRLTLPLTHRLLGQLVAAERPSVSHALHRLSEAGIVSGTAGDWHLHGSVELHLENLIERTVRLTPQDQPASRTIASLASLGPSESARRLAR